MLLLDPFENVKAGQYALPAQKLPRIHFHCAFEFATQMLATLLDSLVRVSRRVV